MGPLILCVFIASEIMEYAKSSNHLKGQLINNSIATINSFYNKAIKNFILLRRLLVVIKIE